jgi:hypothetical protein
MSFLLSGAMGLLILITEGYIVLHTMPSGIGPPARPRLAYVNLWEYVTVAAVFLLGSFVGAYSGLRVARSPECPFRLIGWYMVLTFSLAFVTSCWNYWGDYQRIISGL